MTKLPITAFAIAILLSVTGCSMFTTVTIAARESQIEARQQVIAEFWLAQGYRLSVSHEPIRGYNRYSSDPKNRLVRAWEHSTNYPTIYEFWRGAEYVVLIDRGPRLSKPVGDELKKKLEAIDPSLE